MQQDTDGAVILSASDLITHLECKHATELDRAVMEGRIAHDENDDPLLERLAELGKRHESRYLRQLKREGKRIVTIPDDDRSLEGVRRGTERTLEAMRSGVDVIFQATFLDGHWSGHADFLIRVEKPSELGDFSYEVVDTKLSKHSKAKNVIQIVDYSAHVQKVQGTRPERMYLMLGDGEMETFQTVDFFSYHRAARTRAETAVFGGPQETRPEPVDHCRVCPHQARCNERWKDEDSLFLVPGMRRGTAHRLEDAGIGTLTDLATLGGMVPGINRYQLERMQKQSALMLVERETGERTYHILPPDSLRAAPGANNLGLASLPLPTSDDLFIDFEGDPWAGSRGIEYMLGTVKDVNGTPEYTALWAHSYAEEKVMLETFVDDLLVKLEANPKLHVFHYASYEVSALTRLAAHHGTRESEVAALIQKGVFVDLFRVVKNGIRLSSDSYSIKAIDPLIDDVSSVVEQVRATIDGLPEGERGGLDAAFARVLALVEETDSLAEPAEQGTVRDGMSSVLAYHEWKELTDQAILDDIEQYNKHDCVRLVRLRVLAELWRVQGMAMYGEVNYPRRFNRPDEVAEKSEEELHIDVLRARLVEGMPEDPAERTPADNARVLLADLLEWHRREDRPEWFDYYRRLELTDDELVEDSAALGGLKYEGELRHHDANSRIDRWLARRDLHWTAEGIEIGPRSMGHVYSFPPEQEFRMQIGDTVIDPATGKGAGTVRAVDPHTGVIVLARGTTNDSAHPTAIVPGKPIWNGVQRASIARLADWVVENGIASEGPYRAARDLLLGLPPRLVQTPRNTLEELAQDPVSRDWPYSQALRIMRDLDHACLPVQGPPGSGKTYTGAAMALAATARIIPSMGGHFGNGVEDNRPIAIVASSHRAIGNAVEALVRQSKESGQEVRILQKADKRNGSPIAEFPASGEKSILPTLHATTDRAGATSTLVLRTDKNENIVEAIEQGVVDVVAGTPWLFSRAELAGKFKIIFVDEASQLSLADTLAVSQAGDNVVLLGDPQQLEQPTRGTHPPGAEVSGLRHAIGPNKTIPVGNGVFLDTTFRLPPEVNAFTSEVFYDSRLHPAPSRHQKQLRSLDGSVVSGVGLTYVPVEHKGNRTASHEEARVVKWLVDDLIGQQWTDRNGNVRPITLQDICVVAPYNAQVTRLTHSLPRGARVGTVDKFQGQEAPVVIFSMGASSGEEVARGMGFLFSGNRLNSAISRAQGKAIIVGNPDLLESHCQTPDHVRLLNGYYRYKELATEVEPGRLSIRRSGSGLPPSSADALRIPAGVLASAEAANEDAFTL